MNKRSNRAGTAEVGYEPASFRDDGPRIDATDDAGLRALLEQLPVPAWLAGPDGRRDFFNGRWRALTGQPDGAAAGSAWTDFVHPEDRGACLQHQAALATTHRPVETRYRLRHPDGSHAWLVDSAAPRYRPDGVLAGFIGTCLEISAQQQVETALRAAVAEQEKLFRDLTHRLKNNLQLVVSIISLRMSSIEDPARLRDLEAMLAEIYAVALAQKKLHDGGRKLALQFDDYLQDLIANLRHGSAIKLATAPLMLGIERAIPLGLIANELIATAQWDETHGVDVALTSMAGRWLLRFTGSGLAASAGATDGPDFGLQLVRALARQAQADLTFETDEPAIQIEFSPDPES